MTQEAKETRPCVSRRAFLLAGGTAMSIVLVEGIPGLAGAALQRAEYPRRKIGKLSALKVDTPQFFQYPWKDVFSGCMLVKLGVAAGGGVGPRRRRRVRSRTLCTHMGGPLQGTYQREHIRPSGPCPFHADDLRPDEAKAKWSGRQVTKASPRSFWRPAGTTSTRLG